MAAAKLVWKEEWSGISSGNREKLMYTAPSPLGGEYHILPRDAYPFRGFVGYALLYQRPGGHSVAILPDGQEVPTRDIQYSHTKSNFFPAPNSAKGAAARHLQAGAGLFGLSRRRRRYFGPVLRVGR